MALAAEPRIWGDRLFSEPPGLQELTNKYLLFSLDKNPAVQQGDWSSTPNAAQLHCTSNHPALRLCYNSIQTARSTQWRDSSSIKPLLPRRNIH